MADLKNMTAEELLNKLSNTLDDLQEMRLGREKAVHKAIPDEVHIMLDHINIQYGEEIATIELQEGRLRELIKEKTLLASETIKGNRLQAVFAEKKGTWNHDMLIGMAYMNPPIRNALTPGEPYVTIRKV